MTNVTSDRADGSRRCQTTSHLLSEESNKPETAMKAETARRAEMVRKAETARKAERRGNMITGNNKVSEFQTAMCCYDSIVRKKLSPARSRKRSATKPKGMN